MKTIIKSTNLNVSEAIRTYIEKKAESFEGIILRYLATPQEIKKNPIEMRKERIEAIFEIGTQSSGVKKGIFFCKVRLTVGKAKSIIAKTESPDLYDAIDRVKDIIMSQILEIKDKPISVKKRASRKAKRDFRIDPAAQDREGERMRNESA